MTIAASAVRADVSAYIATGTDQLGATHFGSIDLTTGVYTDIGNMGHLLSGLGTFGNGLYGGLNGGNTVYQVNPGTGQLTPFVTSGATPVGGWNDFGSTTTGLYGLDSIGNLYSINPSTRVVTFIGAAFPNLGSLSLFGLSTGASTLYLTTLTNAESLYTINPTTAVATLVGSAGSGGASGIGALVFANGTLYGGQDQPTIAVVTVDPASGAVTAGPSTTIPSGQFWGLAQLSATAVPEPGYLLAIGVTLLGIGVTARRRANLNRIVNYPKLLFRW
jgi:hypothetical protein